MLNAMVFKNGVCVFTAGAYSKACARSTRLTLESQALFGRAGVCPDVHNRLSWYTLVGDYTEEGDAKRVRSTVFPGDVVAARGSDGTLLVYSRLRERWTGDSPTFPRGGETGDVGSALTAYMFMMSFVSVMERRVI